MKRDFEYIRSYERDLIDQDAKRNELYNAMWRMVYLDWDFARADKDKMPDVRTIVDSTPSDALRNAAIALSNTVPRWTVAPYGTSLFELQHTEMLEHCLEYNFRKMNKRGVGSLLYDKMFSSLLYDMIVTRIDDLEFQFKGVKKLSNLQRRVRSQGRFLGQVFDPRTIHVETGMGTFTALLHVENMRAWDVYHYWKLYENNATPEGKRVAEGLRKMDEHFAGKNAKQVHDMRFIMYEFINDDQILKHGHFFGAGTSSSVITGAEHQTSSANDIIFADEENTLGFINWSVRIGGTRMESDPAYRINPMLAPLHWGNTWETLNVVQSLVLSEPIKRMMQDAHQFQETADGKRLLESDDGVIVGRRGDRVTNIPPAQLDPNAMAVVEALKFNESRSTGAAILSDVAGAKNTPFATLNAMIQVAMSRLDINRRDGAFSCADDALLMLRWVQKTREPLMVYRHHAKTMAAGGLSMHMPAGQQIVINADDFDADFCEVDVDIKPRTPTDEQQQIMSAIQLHDKLRVPYEVVLERLGYENLPLMKNQWDQEQMDTAQQQAAIQALMIKQQPQAEMPQAGGGLSESAFGALGGTEGMSPAMGGSNPAPFAPGLTREAVSGQTQGGAPIAAGG